MTECNSLIYGLDVSNFQVEETSTPEALVALLDRIEQTGGTRPRHLVVRVGLSCEPARLKQIAIAQMRAGAALGMTVSLYVWAYASYPGESCVADALATAQEAGVPITVLWADMEDSNPAPDYAWFYGFVAACQASSVTFYGMYTGNWWLNPHMPGADLSGVWYWAATYDGQENLLEPSFGGMILVGHQYSDRAPDGSGLDMDVFSTEASGYGDYGPAWTPQVV